MHISTAKQVAIACSGAIVGFFGTYLAVNHWLEHRDSSDVLLPHHNLPYYAVDMAGGLVCAGMSYGITAVTNYCQQRPHETLEKMYQLLAEDAKRVVESRRATAAKERVNAPAGSQV